MDWNKSVWRINNSRKVYLTFDDGPVPEATEYVLDVLKESNIKATFFCIGENVQKHPEIFEKVKSFGHSIGNHSYNHLDGWKTNDVEYYKNIDKCRELINTKLFRPPYGRLKFSQYHKFNNEYDVIMWDLVSYDFMEGIDTQKILETLFKKTEGGSIIVFHDSMKSLMNLKLMLPAYIEYCKSKGFEFDSL